MRIVPYYSEPPRTLPAECCVHVADTNAALRLTDMFEIVADSPASLHFWLESYDTEPIALALNHGTSTRFSLNSLWVDEARWAAHADLLPRFVQIVLLPYQAAAPAASYEANVEALLKLAQQHGLHQDQLIVDLCILPLSSEPDFDVYVRRSIWLRETYGLPSLAGLNNVCYREADELAPLNLLMNTLAPHINVGLISIRFVN